MDMLCCPVLYRTTFSQPLPSALFFFFPLNEKSRLSGPEIEDDLCKRAFTNLEGLVGNYYKSDAASYLIPLLTLPF